jgi:hypothetical protein
MIPAYMSHERVMEKLGLKGAYLRIAEDVRVMLDRAYAHGIESALEEIQEGRYIDDGYTYDENIKAKLEEAHRAGYEDGKEDGIVDGRRLEAADALKHMEVPS